MRVTSRLLLLMAALLLALAGCGKQEAPPSPSPTTAPPPKPKMVDYCQQDGDNCKVKVKDIKDEQGKPGHTCGDFNEANAIRFALKTGKYKSIKVVKNDPKDPDFEITITACGDAPADPFANMPKKKQYLKEWVSGGKNPGILDDKKLDNKRYTMMVTEKGAAKGADPHIIVCISCQ